jgi:hypothetical protein
MSKTRKNERRDETRQSAAFKRLVERYNDVCLCGARTVETCECPDWTYDAYPQDDAFDLLLASQEMSDMSDALGVPCVLLVGGDQMQFVPSSAQYELQSALDSVLDDLLQEYDVMEQTPDIGQLTPEIGQLSVPSDQGSVPSYTENTTVPYRVTANSDPVEISPNSLNMMYTLWIVDEYGNTRSRSCRGATDLLTSFWSELYDLAKDDPEMDWVEALLHEDEDHIESAAFGFCALWSDDSPEFAAWWERTKNASAHESLWKGVYVIVPYDIAVPRTPFTDVLFSAIGELLTENVPLVPMCHAGYEASFDQIMTNAHHTSTTDFDDLEVRWNAVKRGGWTENLTSGSRSYWRK